MPLIKSLLKILRRDVEQESEFNEAPRLAQTSLHKANHPVCTVYTKTLGPNFPLNVTELNAQGMAVESAHEIFQTGEYVVVKMVFPKMTVSMPGRVVKIITTRTEATHDYFIEFHRT